MPVLRPTMSISASPALRLMDAQKTRTGLVQLSSIESNAGITLLDENRCFCTYKGSLHRIRQKPYSSEPSLIWASHSRGNPARPARHYSGWQTPAPLGRLVRPACQACRSTENVACGVLATDMDTLLVRPPPQLECARPSASDYRRAQLRCGCRA